MALETTANKNYSASALQPFLHKTKIDYEDKGKGKDKTKRRTRTKAKTKIFHTPARV